MVDIINDQYQLKPLGKVVANINKGGTRLPNVVVALVKPTTPFGMASHKRHKRAPPYNKYRVNGATLTLAGIKIYQISTARLVSSG